MRHFARRSVALVGLVLWSCGGSNPAGPAATPTPQPTPTPAPKPTPTPEPTPTAFSCYLPPMENHTNCKAKPNVGPGLFYPQVVGAIEELRNQKPQFFDGKKVVLVDKYFEGVIRILGEKYGLCASRGKPKDEIGVKNTNAFNEQFDLITVGNDGNTYAVWSYTVTCTPARF
jgi:hypothetical protein